jgi:ribosomal protein S18 acetylase RimI-like enzyme
MKIDVIRADYLDPQQSADLVFLLDSYAQDPMGGGVGLSAQVQENLAGSLAALPHAVSLLCYVDGRPAGLVNCFEAFSTFNCRKLLNIHDLAVLAEFRGLGLSQRMLDELVVLARERACSKLTLEVLVGNQVAKGAYEKFGFAPYELDPTLGQAQFWQMSV